MSKFSLTRYSKKPALRTRATVLVAGMGASLALGAGAASAMDGGAVSLQGLSTDVGSTVSAQADAQKKAIDAEKKAEAGRAKAAADRHERAERQLAKTNGWEKPVDKYGMGEKFGLAGSHWSHGHSGQDFVVPTGTKVKAAHEGTVVKAGPNGGGDGPAYGNAIVIKHGNKTYTQYAHLSKIQVQVGQKVSAGQQIGLAGSTGNSTGPHLHFEVRSTPNYGSAIEPVDFLRGEHVNL